MQCPISVKVTLFNGILQSKVNRFTFAIFKRALKFVNTYHIGFTISFRDPKIVCVRPIEIVSMSHSNANFEIFLSQVHFYCCCDRMKPRGHSKISTSRVFGGVTLRQ